MTDDTTEPPVAARVHIAEVVSPLEAALEYARHGLQVFPCNPLNKAPLVGCEFDANGARVEKSGGLYRASTDEEKINEWWKLWPNAMIGIRMGAPSGVWAIDVDTPKSMKAADGITNWNELQSTHREVLPTHWHLTPSGGLHFLFRYRADKPVGCREGELHGLGINVRGDGGYVIAPPSINAEGGRYEIAVPIHKFMFAEAPDWLYDMILSKRISTEPETWLESPPEAHHRYGDAALRDEAAKLSGMDPETGRNIALNRAAFNMGQLMARGLITHEKVCDALYSASVQNGLVRDTSPRAVRGTIMSGIKAGMQSPRAVSDRRHADPVEPEAEPASEPLGEWDAGGDEIIPPPRGWLLGNVFCRQFCSSLLGEGAAGKTSLRYAQLLSLATGRALTGDHVFTRCRVLIVSMEDGTDELRRRLRAARFHHGVELNEIRGWLYLAAPGTRSGKLMKVNGRGSPIPGDLAEKLTKVIVERKIDIVCLDPFIKTHSVSENDNTAIDKVVQLLTDLAIRHDIAIDVPHHVSKGSPDPGNASRGRGASAAKDAFRLVHTLTAMSREEAEGFGVSEHDRRFLVRMDSGKVNIAPPEEAAWFRLVGVKIDNPTELYPNGDEVQTIEPWVPPATFEGVSIPEINEILDEIDKGLPDGNRYSDHGKARERAAWQVVLRHVPEKTEGQAKKIITTWKHSGLLTIKDYDNPVSRKPAKGLYVDNSKRPS